LGRVLRRTLSDKGGPIWYKCDLVDVSTEVRRVTEILFRLDTLPNQHSRKLKKVCGWRNGCHAAVTLGVRPAMKKHILNHVQPARFQKWKQVFKSESYVMSQLGSVIDDDRRRIFTHQRGQEFGIVL